MTCAVRSIAVCNAVTLGSENRLTYCLRVKSLKFSNASFKLSDALPLLLDGMKGSFGPGLGRAASHCESISLKFDKRHYHTRSARCFHEPGPVERRAGGHFRGKAPSHARATFLTGPFADSSQLRRGRHALPVRSLFINLICPFGGKKRPVRRQELWRRR
jgi:hypothetical protein